MPTNAPQYRTDHLACPLNPGKMVQVRALVLAMRQAATREQRLQWQQFYKSGWQNFESMARAGWSRPWVTDSTLKTTHAQLVMSQVAGSLKGFFGNVQNSYVQLVAGSTLPERIRHQLYFINRKQAWFWACPVAIMQYVQEVNHTTGLLHGVMRKVVVAPDTRQLAKALIRKALAMHKKPHFRNFQPQVDQRACFVQDAHTAQYPHWLVLSMGKGQPRIHLPLQANRAFLNRNARCALYQALAKPDELLAPQVGAGQRFVARLQHLEANARTAQRNPYPSTFCVPNTVRLMLTDDQKSVTIGVVSEMSAAFAHQASTYAPMRDVLAMDMGLCTLLATDDGELHGRSWLQSLEKIDRLITGIARHRQRLGLKVTSDRYRHHVQRLRGWMTTEIHRILNRLIYRKRPGLIIVEALDFSAPNLSRRLNRIIQNFGQGVITKKLAEIQAQYGIAVEYRTSAYSSQECAKCGYVDKRNRTKQDTFHCRFCYKKVHADVQAARVLRHGRSVSTSSDKTRHGRQRLLGARTRLFTARYTRPRGGPADPRFSNPYFVDWALDQSAK